jgi:hypothetical protein
VHRGVECCVNWSIVNYNWHYSLHCNVHWDVTCISISFVTFVNMAMLSGVICIAKSIFEETH